MQVKEVSTELKSPLLDKKVIIVPIEKEGENVYRQAPTEKTMMTGTSRSFKLQLSPNGRLKNPLTEEEREYLEKVTRYDLDVNREVDKNFWVTKLAKINLIKEGKGLETAFIILDLNDPLDFIKYKIALSNSRVCSSWEKRFDNPKYEFVIKDVDSEFVEEFSNTKRATVVLEWLIANKANYKQLYNLMRLFGRIQKIAKQPSKGAATDWLYNELFKAAQNIKDVTLLHELINLDPATFDRKVFLEDAIEVGAVIKIGGKYQLDGGDLIGYSETEAIDFFDKKLNQPIKLRVKQQIEEKFK